MLALFVIGLALSANAHEASVSKAHYLGNAGVMVSHGEERVLFDPWFENPHDYYDSVPPKLEAQLLNGSPPWDGIDAVFISHHHYDHFNPGLLLEYLSQNTSIELYAPEQAARAIRELVDDPGAPVLGRVHGLELEYDTLPIEMQIGSILIEAVRIPHAGWPERHTDVENLAFRVTLDNAVSVLHLGDAGTDPRYFSRHADLWPRRETRLALPPFWFFLDADGRSILDEIIRPAQSIGVHVSNDVPEDPADRPVELRDVDLFTRPGESREIQ
jgi:L-ascorbate metabolism protein UlaG (beta-lactamase superfamily)